MTVINFWQKKLERSSADQFLLDRVPYMDEVDFGKRSLNMDWLYVDPITRPTRKRFDLTRSDRDLILDCIEELEGMAARLRDFL